MRLGQFRTLFGSAWQHLICLICLHLMNSSVGFARDCPPNSLARYRMDIHSTWTETNLNSRLLPKGFPDHWRWNTGIGVSLDDREDPYYNETVRSKIYSFVNKGGLSRTVSELSKPDSGVLDTFLIPAMESTGSDSATVFFIDSNHSRVSFMSKMNAKPFWILSVDSVNLCENGRFHDIFELDLFPFEIRKRPTNHPTIKRQPNPDRGSPNPGSRGTLVSPQSPKHPAYHPQGGSLSPIYIHLPQTPEKRPELTLVTPAKTRNLTDYEPNYYLRLSATSAPVSHQQPGYLYSNQVNAPNTKLIRSRPTSQTRYKPKDFWELISIPQVNPYYLQPSKSPRKMRKLTTMTTTTPVPTEEPVHPFEALYRIERAVNYGTPYGQRAGTYAHNHSNQQLPRRQNQVLEPEVLPRLATVKFTKIATYHLSQLPAFSRRNLRTSTETPLPITIDRKNLNTHFIPHRAINRMAGISRQYGQIPVNNNNGYSSGKRWPSSVPPKATNYASNPYTSRGNNHWQPLQRGK